MVKILIVNRRLFFRTLTELSLSFLTKIVSTTRRNRRLSAKPVAGIVMFSTSVKPKEDWMTERRSTSKLSLRLVTPPLLLIIQLLPVTTSNGTILRFSVASGRCDLQCKIMEKLLKWYYDENRIFPIKAMLKHKQVACMRRKMLFTIFKYLFSFQRYSSF